MWSLMTRLGMVAVVSGLAASMPAESRAAQATVSCPAMAHGGDHFMSEITIDVGDDRLGAYGVTVTHDASVVAVASVAGGATPEFSGTPVKNTVCGPPGSVCETRISATQNERLDGPTGIVSVARVTFNVVAATNSSAAVGLMVRSLFDTDSRPIPATATGCTVMVTLATTTTTPSATTSTVPATSSTITASTSTTTSTAPPPCVSARCAFESGLRSSACGDDVPASVIDKFNQAASLIERAAKSPAKQAKKLRKRTKKALRLAKAAASRARKGKKPISSDCAAALKDAADRGAAGLP